MRHRFTYRGKLRNEWRKHRRVMRPKPDREGWQGLAAEIRRHFPPKKGRSQATGA